MLKIVKMGVFYTVFNSTKLQRSGKTKKYHAKRWKKVN